MPQSTTFMRYWEYVNEKDPSPLASKQLDAVQPLPETQMKLAEQLPAVPVTASSPAPGMKIGKPSPLSFFARHRFIGWRLYAVVAACLLLVGALYVAHQAMATKSIAAKATVRPTPKPTPAPTPPPASPLTGQPVATAAAAAQPVIGVMIENLYPDARPQSGLSAAGVVYEALAEGGITRFLSIFQEPLPSSLGPVRSLRPYYLDWGLEYGVPVAHAGGSQPALAEIAPLGLKDINALVYDGSYFFRTSDRAAPHNLYTNDQLLSKLDTSLGFAVAPTFTPMPRKADTPPTAAPHGDIAINFSTAPYSVHYVFNLAVDAYMRFMGGVPHIDRNTGAQIQVKNIVVEFVPTTYGTQDDGKPETNYALTGSGQALVFTDGTVTPATWTKPSDAAATQILSASGKQVSFNRGNTWYEIVPTGTTVTY
jgi:hypothetical protein